MQKKFRVLLPGEWQLSNLQQQEWPLLAVKASVSQLAIRETCSQKLYLELLSNSVVTIMCYNEFTAMTNKSITALFIPDF